MKHVPLYSLDSARSRAEIEFCAWIGQAAPGDCIEYHRGYLALDATEVGDPAQSVARRELRRVARRAHWAAEQRLVHLVQKRRGPGCFSYLAVARPKVLRCEGAS